MWLLSHACSTAVWGAQYCCRAFTRVCHLIRAGMPQIAALKQQNAVLIKKQRSGGSGNLSLQSACRPTLEPLSAPCVSRAVAGALAGAPLLTRMRGGQMRQCCGHVHLSIPRLERVTTARNAGVWWRWRMCMVMRARASALTAVGLARRSRLWRAEAPAQEACQRRPGLGLPGQPGPAWNPTSLAAPVALTDAAGPPGQRVCCPRARQRGLGRSQRVPTRTGRQRRRRGKGGGCHSFGWPGAGQLWGRRSVGR
jgi:hypothetical protein